MNYIVGAYPMSPCLWSWDEQLEGEFYKGLKELKNMRGLEHPFWGVLHRFDEPWFLRNIDPAWDIVLTCIPGIMDEIKANPHFGLASDDEVGRNAALHFMEQARQAVLKINAATGRNSVIAVQFVSAPQRAHPEASASEGALKRSLETLLGWDWQGADLVVEHCDAFIQNEPYEKGFLKLEEEINAIQQIRTPNSATSKLGLMINWGRSVLEQRDTACAQEHIVQAKQAGLLTGLIFSGCSATDSPYGIWKDSHMPPPQEFNNEFFAEHSLMTYDEIKKSLQTSDYQHLKYLGIKIMARPDDANMNRRIGLIRDTLSLLDRSIDEIEKAK